MRHVPLDDHRAGVPGPGPILVCGLLLALGGPAALAAPGRARCEIQVDSRRTELKVNGVAVPWLDLAALRRALGAPSRTETLRSKIRFERRGFRGSAPSSTMITVTNHHHVYDHLGLVLSTANTSPYVTSTQPVLLDLAYRRIQPSGIESPAVWPKQGFPGVLRVNGVAVDGERLVLPAGVDYRTRSFPFLGTQFGPTSRAMRIDGLYSMGAGPRSVRFFLDDADSRRVGYVRIR
jgi:hypothetical protein